VILCGDALEELKKMEPETAQCCVTSPPYWGLRDYGVDGQIGLEKTPELYVARMVEVFREVKRVLRKDGTLWLNLGDTYSAHKDCKSIGQTIAKGTSRENAHVIPMGQSNSHNTKLLKAGGYKNKDLVGIPWMIAFALRGDGWYLRSDIIWAKPNPIPESVTDRPTKSHEYIFLLTKSAKYYYDAEAIMEPVTESTVERYGYANDGGNQKISYGESNKINRINPIIEKPGHKEELIAKGRNRRTIWEITTKGFSGAHFATFPEEIPTICIKAGTKKGDIVLDPFAGSGTTLEVAKRLSRGYIGIELNQKYVTELVEPRLENIDPLFA